MAENRELALVLKLVADQFQRELKNSQGTLGQFNSFIKDWKVQLTAVGTTLLAVAKSTANFGEEALKGAQKAGQTVETFTALSYAAKLADIDQQQLSVGLKSLSQNMVEAAQRTGDGEALFRRLGVAATDATGQLRPTEQVLFDLADVFAKSADGAGKTEAAVKLFGKAGLEMLPFLNQGKAGITGLMAEAQRLGVVLSTEDAQAANAFNDEIKRLESAMRGLTLQLGQGLLPAMTGGLELFSKMIAKVRELGSETSNVGQNLKNWSDAFGQTGIGQGLMDAFTAMGFGHRKGEGTLPREQFWFDLLGMPAPGSGVLAPGGSAGGDSGGGKSQIALGPDLKKLQEDYRLYITGLTSMGQELLDKQKSGYQLYITGLTSAGQQYLDSIKGTGDEAVKLFEEHQKEIAKDRDILIENERAWISYGETLGASTEFMLQHRLDLVRLELGKELNLNQDQAGRLLIAWQNHDEELAQMVIGRSNKTAAELETIQLRTLEKSKTVLNELSGDFLSGWAQGLRKYATDQTMFGLAADMSRRFFQTTEQGLQRFIFDAAEGRLTRLQDISKSILNIVNQLMSQLASQVITKSFASVFAGVAPGLFGGGESAMTSSFATTGTGFATGGSFRVPGSGGTDSVPVGFWATPGETVDVRTPSQQGSGVSIVINNLGSTPVESTQSGGRGPDGKQMIYVTIRDAMKRSFNEGAMDKVMANRFRMIPQAGG